MSRVEKPFARARTAARLLLKAGISAGLLALIVHKTNATGVVERLLEVSLPMTLAAAALMASFSLLPALRWKKLLHLGGAEFGLPRLYQLLMMANFLAQAIPSVGADGIRAWYLYRHGKSLSLASAVNSVLLDRLTALTALLLLCLVSLPWLQSIVPPSIIWWMIGLTLLAVSGAAAILTGFDWLPAAWRHWRIIWLARNLTGACRALVGSPLGLFQVISLSVAVHLLLSVFVYSLAGLVRVPVGLAECVLLFPLVILVATVPVGIAGWGMREGAMVVAFGFLGMPAADALLVSILYGLVVALSTVPGLIFWLAPGHEREMRIEPDGK